MRTPTGSRSRRLRVGQTASGQPVELDIMEAGPADGPLIVLAHGFPESSWSWRHQMAPLADAGWHVVAPDQRGYGRSTSPGTVADYGTDALSADLLALLDDAKREQAVFVGHDWGALVVWDLIRMHPSRVRAAVGVSVPYVQWPMQPLALMRSVWGDNFFYIIYFQDVGPAETELGADPRTTLRRILWSASGPGTSIGERTMRPAAGTGFLDVMSEPPADGIGAWCTDDDLNAYTDAYEASGFFGPVSWYRNLDANYERIKDLDLSAMTMPTFFIAGDADPVIAMDTSGIDRMLTALPDHRGHVMLPGVGHWTQQEDPDGFNTALLGFLGTL
jgi:pimeloyl-ACP methyl ester carboxylesterase